MVMMILLMVVLSIEYLLKARDTRICNSITTVTEANYTIKRGCKIYIYEQTNVKRAIKKSKSNKSYLNRYRVTDCV